MSSRNSDSWHLSSTLKRIYLPLCRFWILTKRWLILVSSLYETVIAHSSVSTKRHPSQELGLNMNIKAVSDTAWINLHDFRISFYVQLPDCLPRQHQGCLQAAGRKLTCSLFIAKRLHRDLLSFFLHDGNAKNQKVFVQMKLMSAGEEPRMLVWTGPPRAAQTVSYWMGQGGWPLTLSHKHAQPSNEMSSSSHHLNDVTQWRLNWAYGHLTRVISGCSAGENVSLLKPNVAVSHSHHWIRRKVARKTAASDVSPRISHIRHLYSATLTDKRGGVEALQAWMGNVWAGARIWDLFNGDFCPPTSCHEKKIRSSFICPTRTLETLQQQQKRQRCKYVLNLSYMLVQGTQEYRDVTTDWSVMWYHREEQRHHQLMLFTAKNIAETLQDPQSHSRFQEEHIAHTGPVEGGGLFIFIYVSFKLKFPPRFFQRQSTRGICCYLCLIPSVLKFSKQHHRSSDSRNSLRGLKTAHLCANFWVKQFSSALTLSNNRRCDL